MRECEAKGIMGAVCKNQPEVCVWSSHIQYELEGALPELVHKDLTGCANLSKTKLLLNQRIANSKGTISVAPLPQTTTL